MNKQHKQLNVLEFHQWPHLSSKSKKGRIYVKSPSLIHWHTLGTCEYWWHSNHRPNNKIASNLALIQPLWIADCILKQIEGDLRTLQSLPQIIPSSQSITLRDLLGQIIQWFINLNCLVIHIISTLSISIDMCVFSSEVTVCRAPLQRDAQNTMTTRGTPEWHQGLVAPMVRRPKWS